MNPEEVLRGYAAGEVPPVRLIADDLLVSARRRARRARIRMVAAAGVATALMIAGVAFASPLRRPERLPAVVPTRSVSPTPPRPMPPPLTCTAEPIPEANGVPADARTVATIDPTGRYIVGIYAAAGDVDGLLIWKDGVGVRHPAGRNLMPYSINSAGVVAGYVRENNTRVAALYRGGELVRLPLPAGASRSEAFKVNAGGDAVGYASDEANRSWAMFWPAGGGMTVLSGPEPDVYQAQVSDIRDDGLMIGSVSRKDEMKRAYRWNADGTGTFVEGRWNDATPRAMAGDWVVGSGSQPSAAEDPDHPPLIGGVRFNLRTGESEQMKGFQSWVVSKSGVAYGVVGEAESDQRAALWYNGRITELPLRNPTRPRLWSVSGGITADGRTVVATTWAGQRGELDITRWSCT